MVVSHLPQPPVTLVCAAMSCCCKEGTGGGWQGHAVRELIRLEAPAVVEMGTCPTELPDLPACPSPCGCRDAQQRG